MEDLAKKEKVNEEESLDSSGIKKQILIILEIVVVSLILYLLYLGSLMWLASNPCNPGTQVCI